MKKEDMKYCPHCGTKLEEAEKDEKPKAFPAPAVMRVGKKIIK